jgi:hypothetical protein
VRTERETPGYIETSGRVALDGSTA